MAITPENYSPTGGASSLGNLLQIVFTDGVINQISEDHRDWEMIYKHKVKDEQPRAIAFMLQSSLGARATQSVEQGGGLVFPKGQKTNNKEYEAQLKQIASTVELELDIYERAMKSPKYVEPLAHEIQAKSISQKRINSATLHKDGTGVIGKVEGAAAVKAGDNSIEIFFDDSVGSNWLGSQSYGGERWCEFEDALDVSPADGSSSTLGGGASYLLVVDKDRENNSVICEVYDANDALVAIADDAAAATVVGAGNVVYRKDQPIARRPDLSGASAPSADFNTLSLDFVGLETLYANDGRTIHGIEMKGATAATHADLKGKSLDISSFQRGLSRLKTRVGATRYKYKQMLCSPEAKDFMIESNETDRRLVSMSDDKRGFKGFGYVHENDTLELVSSEFCKSDAIYVMPESSKQKGVCELYGETFKETKVDGQSTFMQQNSDGQRVGIINKFMLGRLTLVSRHPAAVLKFKNFKVD